MLGAPLIVGDTGDRDLVARVLQRARHRHRAAFRRAHDRAGVGVRTRSSTTATTPARRATCSSNATRAGVSHFVFSSTAAVYGIPGRGSRARGFADRADQSVRHVEADERVDAARPRRGVRETALRGAALLQRRGQRPGRAHRPHARRRRRCWSRWRARWPPASGRRCRSSAPTIRRRTAPACATTSTSRTSPSAHLSALDYLRSGRRVDDAELRLRPRLQRARSR